MFGTIPAMHTVMRFLNYHLVTSNASANLFKQYSPRVVFSTDVHNENDVLVMIEARRKGVEIISMVRSWDNVEMYGILRIIPETLLVWGDFLKNAVLKLDAMNSDDVKVVGVPHYDRYLKGPTMSRADFFRSLGADSNRKLILFTPVGDMYVKENDVDGLVLSELCKTDANILVRMPPADTVSFGGFIPPKNVFFYQPGAGAHKTGRKEISREDDDHLINSLYFSDCVVTGPSTIMLDAVVLDRPVLLFGFEKNKKRYKESIISRYNSRHLQAVITRGGARMTNNAKEFHSTLSEYLSNSKKDNAERRRAVEFVCYKTDGKSCERVIDVLQSKLLH